MAEEYREPIMKQENGFCYLQNGTHQSLSGATIWSEYVQPMLDLTMDKNPRDEEHIKRTEKCTFYELLLLGSEDDTELLDEIMAMIQQSAKMKTQILKKGGQVIIPDAAYFSKLYNDFCKEFDATHFYNRAELTSKFAVSLAKEYRNCMRRCIAHNYTTAVTINNNTENEEDKVPIPAVAIKAMEKITTKEIERTKDAGKGKK